jgi:hypothetical protein
VYDDGGYWIAGEEPLPLLADAPPPELIRVDGARLLRIYDPPEKRKPSDGGWEAVVIATAPRQDGPWGGLLAWIGRRIIDAHQTGRARWAWCLLVKEQIEVVKPRRPYSPEAEWYGIEMPNQLGIAIRQAALLLPEHLRDAAMTPHSNQP